MRYFRSFLVVSLVLALGWTAACHAGERPSEAIKGTWYSEGGSLTFSPDGTINYKGKRYYFAVSGAGIIKLEGKQGSRILPYQLYGDKLTITADGKTTVYSRKK